MKFGELKAGDVFRYKGSFQALKVEPVEFRGNARIVGSGEMIGWAFFKDDADVTPLDVHFTAREPGERRDSNER